MRVAAGGSSTCSRPEVESVAQTGRSGQAVMAARPVSIPSESASLSPSPRGASRTAPPATRPSIFFALSSGALRMLPSGSAASHVRCSPMTSPFRSRTWPTSAG
jgi:hypothetical protein